jgi:hypothetical protein
MHTAHARSLSLQGGSKKVIIIILLSLLLVVGSGVYTFFSLNAWKGYQTRLLGERDQYSTLKQQALDGSGNVTDRLTAIRQLDDKVKHRSDLCYMSPVFAWQAKIVPILKDGVNSCIVAKGQLDAIAKPLTSLRQYLDVAAQLQSDAKKLSPPAPISSKDWMAQGLHSAKNLQSKIKVLSATGEGLALKKQAQTASDELVTNWQALIQGKASGGNVAYAGALVKLTKSYANFVSLAKSTDASIQMKADKLSKAATSVGL